MERAKLGLFVVAIAWIAPPLAAQTAPPPHQKPSRTVESVLSSARIKTESDRIDTLLEYGLKRLQCEPLPRCDDATFARRAYLTVIGRIPTLAETEAFLADQDPKKRHTLVDRLLDSPGYTSATANWWFDILRVKSRSRQLSGEPFAHFVRESIQQDKPFDQFVREMIAALGPAHQKGKGATGYLLRDMNMPHDAMANTIRVFLGTRLECAQCHNHPFDSWTQMDFYGMAAYFGGLRYQDNDALMQLAGARTRLANADDKTRNLARQLTQTLMFGLSGTGSGMERLPDDYHYDDQKPGSEVLANTLFGADTKLKYVDARKAQRAAARDRGRRAPADPGIDSRAVFADWLTSPKNPMFAKTIANRLWAHVFGRGLVDPIDDWKKETAAVHPEVLAQLEKLVVDLDFDLRQVTRVLLHSELFQRQSPTADPAGDKPYPFAGALLRRMTAEQVWDSLLTLVFDDIDERLREPDARAAPVYASYDELKNSSVDDILKMAESGVGAAQMMRKQAQEQRKSQPLTGPNDAERQRMARPLLRELAMARRNGDQKRVAELAAELEKLGLPLGRRAARGSEGELLRASDLEQPARSGHLLRQFGQSDRETIEAGNADATVPQVLTLLNGFLDQNVIAGQSALNRDLLTAPDGERRVRIAFLTTLNREPTADEVRTWRRAIAIDGDTAIADLVWVLCNSNEFRFVR